MIILQVTSTQYAIFSAIIIGLVALLVILFYSLSKRKSKKSQAGSEFAEQMLESLGGASNVTNIKLNRRRMEIEVDDINQMNPKLMRELKLGAIITRNTIKVLVKDNPREVYKYINQKRKEV